MPDRARQSAVSFCDLDWHLQIDEARLQWGQRQFVFGINPETAVAGAHAAVKFKLWCLPGLEVRSEVDLAKQAVRFGARTTYALRVMRRIPISDRVVEVSGLDLVVRAEPIDLFLGLMPDALADEECAPRRAGGGSNIHSPRVRR